jgi:protein arginine kinase activator
MGKIPKRAGGDYKLQKDLERLKAELRQMIEQEEYEKAAQLRDKIRELENK